jgi:hypothetical protein
MTLIERVSDECPLSNLSNYRKEGIDDMGGAGSRSEYR